MSEFFPSQLSSHRAISEAVRHCQPRAPVANIYQDCLLLSGIDGCWVVVIVVIIDVLVGSLSYLFSFVIVIVKLTGI